MARVRDARAVAATWDLAMNEMTDNDHERPGFPNVGSHDRCKTRAQSPARTTPGSTCRPAPERRAALQLHRLIDPRTLWTVLGSRW
jgi:hypothetical protein